MLFHVSPVCQLAEAPPESLLAITIWQVMVTTFDCTGFAAAGAKMVPIGRPIGGVAAYCLDPDSLTPAAARQEGELFVSGVCLARGYAGRPDLTAERFLSNPFWQPGDSSTGRMYRTGDLVSALPDGSFRSGLACRSTDRHPMFSRFLSNTESPASHQVLADLRAGNALLSLTTHRYLGRADGQVKLRGFRLELGEIEAVLAAVDGVQDAVVSLQVLPCSFSCRVSAAVFMKLLD